MIGRIHSIQSLGTVDGPGVRSVIFMAGCPLRCDYCHNPDTREIGSGEEIESEALAERILRFYPYISSGGVTFSGGEPTLQARFVADVAKKLKTHGLHVALDTCGNHYDAEIERMLSYVDLILLDLKYPTEEEYERYTGGSLARTLNFIRQAERLGIEVWIRQVIVPGRTDRPESLEATAKLLSPFSCVSRVELLPFRKLCLEKYQSLGIPFPLGDVPAANPDAVRELEKKHFARRHKTPLIPLF